MTNSGVSPEMLNASGDNLLGLLNNILDLSKLDAGKFDFEALPFSLRSADRSRGQHHCGESNRQEARRQHGRGRRMFRSY